VEVVVQAEISTPNQGHENRKSSTNERREKPVPLLCYSPNSLLILSLTSLNPPTPLPNTFPGLAGPPIAAI